MGQERAIAADSLLGRCSCKGSWGRNRITAAAAYFADKVMSRPRISLIWIDFWKWSIIVPNHGFPVRKHDIRIRLHDFRGPLKRARNEQVVGRQEKKIIGGSPNNSFVVGADV